MKSLKSVVEAMLAAALLTHPSLLALIKFRATMLFMGIRHMLVTLFSNKSEPSLEVRNELVVAAMPASALRGINIMRLSAITPPSVCLSRRTLSSNKRKPPQVSIVRSTVMSLD